MKQILISLLTVNIVVSIIFYYKIPKNINITYALNGSVDLLEKCNADLIPQVIKKAQENIFNISLEMSVSHPAGSMLEFSPYSVISGGSGFLIRPDIVVSARHILIDPIFALKRIEFPFILGKNFIPISNRYKYRFYAIYGEDGDLNRHPLSLITMGRLERDEDYIVLKSDKNLPGIKPLEINTNELNEKDIVYNGGFLPISFSYPSLTGQYKDAIGDIIKCNLKGRVNKVIKNMPLNKVGVGTYYRIALDTESGYSGGPILNTRGQAVAMTLSVTQRKIFTYAISIKEVDDFVVNLEKNGTLLKN